jgi:DNA-binding transcriptional MerR regulator
MDPSAGTLLRIGELSRRSGVSDHALRAWESRYGLLQPVRTTGGFRLYSAADERRIRRMQAFLADGLSASEAARAVLREETGNTQTPAAAPPSGRVEDLTAALRSALDAFDEASAQAVLDRLFSDLSVTTVLRDVVMPYLADLGERWQAGSASVAQEHFASNVIRGRLAGLARGWGGGQGPSAVLACAPGEHHDMSLMVFGIALNRHGWRIRFLGADTPVADVIAAADATSPDLVVVTALLPERLRPIRRELASLARRAPLALAGPGVTAPSANAMGAQLLARDPVTEAEAVAAAHRNP